MSHTPLALTRRLCLARLVGALLAAGLAATGAVHAADDFPTRPITLVLGLAAGGATDVQVRALAQAASRELGQPIVVVNRTGVAATLGPSQVAKTAQPDGYTLAVLPATIFRIPHVQKVDYDPIADFTYLMNVTPYSYAISVAANSRFKTLTELVTHAKANPGKVNYGASGIGSTGHINIERFAKAAGIQVNMVPFAGAAQVFQNMLGGHVDFCAEGGFGPMADSGQIRVLGVLGERRLPMRPDWPTVREAGVSFREATSFWGLAGPRGMDPRVTKRLHDAFKKALDDAAFQEALAKSFQVLGYQSGEDFVKFGAAYGRGELEAIKELGIKVE